MQFFPKIKFYHSEKLQSTKTPNTNNVTDQRFYHSEKLQSTKTKVFMFHFINGFYHSEKLQSTKTGCSTTS